MKKKKGKKSKEFIKKPKNFVKIKETEEISNYHVEHVRRGCYQVILERGDKMIYLTNFKNKKAAEKFVEAHENDQVTIDPETCVPTPDFE